MTARSPFSMLIKRAAGHLPPSQNHLGSSRAFDAWTLIVVVVQMVVVMALPFVAGTSHAMTLIAAAVVSVVVLAIGVWILRWCR